MLKFILALLLTTVNGLQYSGADLSSLTVTQRTATLKDTSGATISNVMSWVHGNGVNMVRLRLWINPSNGDYNYAYVLALAQKAQTAGMVIYLDFHYSDTWADPGHQTTSPSWSSYNTIGALAGQVYTYTKTTLNNFKAAGINIAIVSIGNEINAGMMWPLGSFPWGGNSYNLAKLLHSAAWGVKDSSYTTKPLIAIHLANGWDYTGTVKPFFDSVLGHANDGTVLLSSDFDMIAFSYYPEYSQWAYMGSITYSLATTASNYGKKVIIAETNWPVVCGGPPTFPSDLTYIPFSSAGQTTFLTALKGAVKAVGSSRGVGILYWEPTWVQNKGLGIVCGSNNGDVLFFDYTTNDARNNWNIFATMAAA